MASPSGHRIHRGPAPAGKLRESNYRRRALPCLLRDFQKRCAYSMRHARFADGEERMEVDHFNPTLRGEDRHRYKNLYLSCGHCNRKKSNYWPTRAEVSRGLRLLDPCAEQDYGLHIYEDPHTHLLTSSTPAGRYHITILDLNAPTFVNERTARAEIRAECSRSMGYRLSGDDWLSDLAEVSAFCELIDALIPEIPPPPLS